MDRSINMEADGFVLVSKDAVDNEDNVSVQSDRSSLCMVEDPSADPGLFGDSEDEDRDAMSPPDVPLSLPPKTEDVPPKETLISNLTPILDSDDSETSTETAVIPKLETPQPVTESPKAVSSSQPKYVCHACGVDVAAKADIVWEGYMGANLPAFLFKKTKNTEPSATSRQQQLSTGLFLVQDVKCRNCSAQFGWSYLKSFNQEQKYKEGTTIIQRSMVHRVN